MKYFLTLLLLLQIISCSAEDKKESSKNSESTITVKNIQKTCYKNVSKNIIDYSLCSNWTLTENDIKEIISLGKKNTSSEIVNIMTPEVPSWISADLVINEKPFKIEINAMSYYYLIDNKGNRELYTFSNENKDKAEKYFIRVLSEEDDQKFENNKKESKQNLINKSSDLSKWIGTYTFDNNNYEQLYRKYTLIIDSKNSNFYEGDLPGCKIYLIPFISENELYFYFDGEKTDCSGYDTSFIDKLQDGEFIFKISTKNDGGKYFQSPIIKYWNDKKNDFETNSMIKISK